MTNHYAIDGPLREDETIGVTNHFVIEGPLREMELALDTAQVYRG